MTRRTRRARPNLIDEAKADSLLTPGEVAAIFRVDPKTVTRWAAAGRIGCIRTLGGHRRFRESEVKALLEAPAEEADFDDELVVDDDLVRRALEARNPVRWHEIPPLTMTPAEMRAEADRRRRDSGR